jgi:hypothetical protein
MLRETDPELIADSLSATTGRVDALAAAVFGILELSKSIPELSVAIKEHLAEQYANRLADSENPQYTQAFKDTREQLLKIIR